MNSVWVFNGSRNNFPSAVFSSREKAEFWIAEHRLSGCLTKYPLDASVYDWVIEQGYWTPSRPYQYEAKFVQSFSSAYLEHDHYEEGVRCGTND